MPTPFVTLFARAMLIVEAEFIPATLPLFGDTHHAVGGIAPTALTVFR